MANFKNAKTAITFAPTAKHWLEPLYLVKMPIERKNLKKGCETGGTKIKA